MGIIVSFWREDDRLGKQRIPIVNGEAKKFPTFSSSFSTLQDGPRPGC